MIRIHVISISPRRRFVRVVTDIPPCPEKFSQEEFDLGKTTNLQFPDRNPSVTDILSVPFTIAIEG